MRFRSAAHARRWSRLVADEYLAAPDVDPTEVWRWHVLASHIRKLFKRIQSGKNGVRVVFVPGQPYTSDVDLKRQVARTKTLYVSTDYNSHPVFDPETNLMFRAVHDYVGHIGRDTSFSDRGEVATFNAHARMVPPAALPALFTEVVGQACVATVHGFFPTQKIAVLPFDFRNLGVETT